MSNGQKFKKRVKAYAAKYKMSHAAARKALENEGKFGSEDRKRLDAVRDSMFESERLEGYAGSDLWAMAYFLDGKWHSDRDWYEVIPEKVFDDEESRGWGRRDAFGKRMDRRSASWGAVEEALDWAGTSFKGGSLIVHSRAMGRNHEFRVQITPDNHETRIGILVALLRSHVEDAERCPDEKPSGNPPGNLLPGHLRIEVSQVQYFMAHVRIPKELEKLTLAKQSAVLQIVMVLQKVGQMDLNECNQFCLQLEEILDSSSEEVEDVG